VLAKILFVALVLAGACFRSELESDPPSGNERPGGGGDDPNDPGDCLDVCVPGSAMCVGNGVQACRRVNGCARYSPVTPCGAGSQCTDGVCIVQGSSEQANLYIGPETLCSLSGNDVLCDVRLCNGGSVAAVASTLKFFLDRPATVARCADPAIPGETWLDMDDVGPGACVSSGEMTFFQSPTPGSHKLALFADGLCQTMEADENDNYVLLTPDLYVAPPTQAELWFNPTSMLYWDTANNEIWGEISVCNFGTMAADSFYVDFSPDATLPACGWVGAEYQLHPGLAAGACTPMWTTARYAPGAGFAKVARVMVDSLCLVEESNELNVWSWDYD
jgi:hypothetical protein